MLQSQSTLSSHSTTRSFPVTDGIVDFVDVPPAAMDRRLCRRFVRADVMSLTSIDLQK